MSEIIEIYEDNLKILFSRLSKIFGNINIQSREQAKSSLSEAETNLKEADKIIKNIEIELMGSAKAQEYSIPMKNYKTGAEQFRKRLTKAKEDTASETKKDNLVLTEASTHRDKLINDNDELIWNSFDKIQQAKRSTIEMENVSIQVSQDLNNHTDKLRGIDTKVNEMDQDLSKGSRLIRKMMQRQFRNKVIIFLFTVGVVLVFIGILAYRLFGPNEKTPHVKDSSQTEVGSGNSG